MTSFFEQLLYRDRQENGPTITCGKTEERKTKKIGNCLKEDRRRILKAKRFGKKDPHRQPHMIHIENPHGTRQQKKKISVKAMIRSLVDWKKSKRISTQ